MAANSERNARAAGVEIGHLPAPQGEFVRRRLSMKLLR